MTPELIFTNARIVLADEIVEGTLKIQDGKISDISSGNCRTGEDCAGDVLIPGCVELHTDHLEPICSHAQRCAGTWRQHSRRMTDKSQPQA